MKISRRISEKEIERQANDFLAGVLQKLPSGASPRVREVLQRMTGVAPSPAARIAPAREQPHAAMPFVRKTKPDGAEWRFDVERDGNGLMTRIHASRTGSS